MASNRTAIIARYMESVQTQITSISRANCVDLMIEASELLRCAPNTLHVAVNYLDVFLSGNDVNMRNLLVAGMTCLKMADDKDLKQYADFFETAITAYEFLVMEGRIHKYYLEKGVAVPVTTAYSFLQRFVYTAQRGRHAPLQGLNRLAAYLVDVSLLSTEMLRFSPSMVAASSVFLAQYILDPDISEKPWSVILRDNTKFQASDLKECVLVLHRFLGSDEIRLPAIAARNSPMGTGFAALKIIPPAIPLHTFEDVYGKL